MSGLTPRGKPLFIWIVFLTSFTSVIMLLRFWAARLVKRPFSADDYIVVLAYINILIEAGLFIWGLFEGSLGSSHYQLSPHDTIILSKMRFASSLVWLIENVAVKLSVLCLYNMAFTSTRFKRVSHMVMGLAIVYGISFLCALLSRCRPIESMWDPLQPHVCRDSTVETGASAIISLCIGLVIIVLPIPMLRTLQAELYKKVILGLVFGIGIVTVGVMYWRAIATIKWVENSSIDFGGQLVDFALMTMLELCLGVILVCIPTLSPLTDIYLTLLTSKRRPRTVEGSSELPVDEPQPKYFELEGSQGHSNAGRIYQNAPLVSVPQN